MDNLLFNPENFDLAPVEMIPIELQRVLVEQLMLTTAPPEDPEALDELLEEIDGIPMGVGIDYEFATGDSAGFLLRMMIVVEAGDAEDEEPPVQLILLLLSGYFTHAPGLQLNTDYQREAIRALYAAAGGIITQATTFSLTGPLILPVPDMAAIMRSKTARKAAAEGVRPHPTPGGRGRSGPGGGKSRGRR